MSEITELSKRVDMLTQRLDTFIEQRKTSSERRDALVQAIIEKTLAGAIWALIAFSAKALWDLAPWTSK